MEIQLINQSLFLENSPIKSDTVITDFVPYINIAQKIYIVPILGRELTEQLQTQIKAASVDPAPTQNPITPDNQALIMALAPALSFWAVYQGLPFHWASIVNKGVTLRESENSSAVNINDIAQLRRWVRDDAIRLGQDLANYLCACKADYPLWSPTAEHGCGCGTSGNTNGAAPFDAGIQIAPKYRRRQ